METLPPPPPSPMRPREAHAGGGGYDTPYGTYQPMQTDDSPWELHEPPRKIHVASEKIQTQHGNTGGDPTVPQMPETLSIVLDKIHQLEVASQGDKAQISAWTENFKNWSNDTFSSNSAAWETEIRNYVKTWERTILFYGKP